MHRSRDAYKKKIFLFIAVLAAIAAGVVFCIAINRASVEPVSPVKDSTGKDDKIQKAIKDGKVDEKKLKDSL